MADSIYRIRKVQINRSHCLYGYCELMTAAANNLTNAVRYRQRQVLTAVKKAGTDLTDNEKEVLAELQMVSFAPSEKHFRLSYVLLDKLLKITDNPDYYRFERKAPGFSHGDISDRCRKYKGQAKKEHLFAIAEVIWYTIAMKYNSNSNVFYSCKYHVVWCPKYRRKVLVDGIDTRLKEILYSTADAINADIIEMEVMPDHVHILLAVDPQFGINNAIRRLKGVSSRILRSEFPSLRSKLPTLWTNSYFVSTVGGAPLSVIKQYIENQKSV